MKLTELKIFGFLVLLLMLVAAQCGGGTDDTKARQDSARTATLQRSAEVVVSETLRYNLSVCAADAVCATGQDCKTYVPVTEPGVCKKESILSCICPEKTVCLMSIKSTNTSSYSGKCFTADELKAKNASQAPAQPTSGEPTASPGGIPGQPSAGKDKEGKDLPTPDQYGPRNP